MKKPLNDKYGRLTVIEWTGDRYKDGDKLFLCKCDCGNKRIVRAFQLRKGRTVGCKDCMAKARIKHGKSYDSVYKLWATLKQRCGNAEGYETITYPDKWETFEGFWDDMGPTHFDGASIDRIDGTKSYSKDNCQWLTVSEHATKSANERWQK